MADLNGRKDNAEYIRDLMKQQGVSGNPSKHLVLWGWDKIIARWSVYQIEAELPRPVPIGATIWIMEDPNSPELTPVKVMEDYKHSLWVTPYDRDVEFRVAVEDAKPTSIPLRPKVIHRRDLEQYVGQEVANIWHNRRRRYKSP